MENQIEFKIEKNIPIPLRHGKHNKTYQLMEVGDSIFISDARLGRSYALSFGVWIKRKKLDWEKVVRKEKEGIRIWRIK